MVKTIKVSGAGAAQTESLNVFDSIGTTPRYTIQVATSRGKVSDPSNEISIAIVEVPGIVLISSVEMDQHRIRVEWKPPVQNPSLAEVYIVRRSDGVVQPPPVTETHFDDAEIVAGNTYSYTVTAARAGTPAVPGPPSLPVLVLARDTKGPKTPTGLQPPVVTESGAILRWDLNTESDLAGYRVYRSDNPNTGFTQLGTEIYAAPPIRDEGYKPGYYYKVSAEDMDRNQSGQSSAVRAP